MAGSKPDEREIARPQAGSQTKARAVPPPLPPSGTRSSRAIRAASTADAEAPTLYSQVGRRSSPGMPAVSITVDDLKSLHPDPPEREVTVNAGPPPLPPTMPELAAGPPKIAEKTVEKTVEKSLEKTLEKTLEKALEKKVDPSVEKPRPRVAAKGLEPEPPTEKNVRRSVRPAAPEPFTADKAGVESIAQTFDRLLGSEVDSRFGDIKQASERPPAAGALDDGPAGLAEVRDLFEQLAANHVRPVREFVIDLRWGEASREWVPLCLSAVDSLQRGAQKLGLGELDAALGGFAASLHVVAGEPGSIILEGATRDGMLKAYDRLVEVLPKAFALDMDRSQRESLIIQSILLQIPEVHRVTMERLHAAGLNGIAMLADARPQEIAETAGINRKLADRIVEAFRAYREERQAHVPDPIHGREREKLDALLNELEAHHAAFEHVAEAWTKNAASEKLRLRRARHRTLMEISVILARIGEIALLQRLEKVPFDRKLDGLRSYLKEPPSAYAHAP